MRQAVTLTPSERILDCLLRSIRRAKRRIYIQMTIFGSDEIVALLHQQLKLASQRGVDVCISADSFTISETIKPFNIRRYHSRPVRRTMALQKELAKAGIKFQWLGGLSPIFVAGRTHSKWVVVDDWVYTFGGVNLYDQGIGSSDYLLKLKDAKLADKLVTEQNKIMECSQRGRFYRSHSFAIPQGNVLVDGGILGDSLIYARACELTKQATKVTYVSQYCPSGRLGLMLHHRQSAIYFNDWHNASPFNALVIRLGTWLSGHQTEYTGSRYIHAKYMIFYFADGSKKAITGSHNFSNGGVWLGTREIALETDDPKIIAQLERFTKQYVEISRQPEIAVDK